jgi:selenocysteine lyase/cysteine desulfurase
MSVVVLAQQMASNVMPWQRLCELRDLKLVVVTEPDLDGPSSWADRVLAAIDGTTAVVALPAVHWCTGAKVDLVRISAVIHATRNARPPAHRPLLVIDGTQSIGAMPFDVAVIKPDVVACSVHKWLCGPYGASLVYVAPHLHGRWVGLEHHERNRVGSDHPEYDALGAMGPTGYPAEYMGGARRFDCGGRPNPVILPMVAEALQLVHRWTPSAVQVYCDRIAGKLRAGLGRIHTADGDLAYIPSQLPAHPLQHILYCAL